MTNDKGLTVSPPTWRFVLRRLPLVYISALIYAVCVVVFLRPAEIVAGGVTGIGLILNLTIQFPLSAAVLIGNVIMLSIGYRQLGGWNTVLLTVAFVLFYTVNLELVEITPLAQGISDDRLLNALYAGIVGGIGGGLVYKAGGTMGGSSVISRMLNMRFGVPTSSSYLYVDSLVILAAGYFFGWEASLFSLLTLVVDGFVADYVLEGPSLIRTATIITDKPDDVSGAIISRLRRGVTSWGAIGRYTHQPHEVLFVTVGRAQVSELQVIVHEVDPTAFVVIGQGHVAYGQGFKSTGRAGRLLPYFQPQEPTPLDENPQG